MCARVNEREKPLCRSNNAKETFPFPSSLVSFRSFFPCFSEFFFSTFKLTRTLLLEGLYGVSCELTGISFNPPLRSPPPARTCRPACRISAPKHLDTRTRAARRRFLLVKNKFHHSRVSNFNQFGNIVTVEESNNDSYLLYEFY